MASVELVGVVNITPDSFSDGGRYFNPNDALEHANRLINEGASYLDVGAESTRPGATPISIEEEWRRLQPVLSALVPVNPGHLSVDTYRPETIRRVVNEIGSVIINDVTAFNNPAMVETAAELRLQCIVSHLPAAVGTDIQAAHKNKELVDSITQVRDELLEKREKMIAAGIDAEMIILDPGIGFGKTPELNWELLRFAQEVPRIDVMIGYSRKRFLGEHRGDIDTNFQAGRISVEAGARYLRVHDVAGHRPLTI